MEHVDVGGVQTAYIRAGSGPAIVMVHGAAADSRTWQWMLPDLARDHTVVAWDAPGFGPPFQQIRTELLAGDLPTSASIGVSALVDSGLHYEFKMIAAAPT